jgi:hypothetical protein
VHLVEIDPAGIGRIRKDRTATEAPTGSCFDLSAGEALQLAGVLDEAGAEADFGTTELGEVVTLTISWPMLPHGVPAFTGG